MNPKITVKPTGEENPDRGSQKAQTMHERRAEKIDSDRIRGRGAWKLKAPLKTE